MRTENKKKEVYVVYYDAYRDFWVEKVFTSKRRAEEEYGNRNEYQIEKVDFDENPD